MSNLDPDSVTCWISALKAGDVLAAQRLWEQYYPRLVAVARRRLADVPRRAFDEEDIAVSAFHSFCQRASNNCFPQLNDRENLWSLLVTITARKVLQQQRHQLSQRRGGGKLRGESAFGSAGSEGEMEGIAEVVGAEPSPEFAAMLAEHMDQLLEQLGDESLKSVAVAKMEGLSNMEIAQRLGLSDRTIRRKLKVVQTILESQS